MKSMMKRVSAGALAVVLSAALLAGCGSKTTGTTNETVSGAELSNAAASTDAAVTVNGDVTTMGVARVYAYVMKTQVEGMYGADASFWSVEVEDGVSYSDYVRDLITDELTRISILNKMASEYDVKISEEDQKNIDTYVENFMGSVDEATMKEFGFTADDVKTAYEMSTISTHVQEAMLEKEEVELTDEEKEDARCIKVAHILITTMDTTKKDADGNDVPMEDDELEAYKEGQLKIAEEVYNKAVGGEDFKKLSEEYTSPNAGYDFVLDKKGMDPITGNALVDEFTQAAWALSEGDISEPVQSVYGYHIIKCLSENDEEGTNAAIDNLKKSKQSAAVEQKIQDMIDKAKVEVSDAWKAFTLVTETAPAAADETDAETDAAFTEETETQTETEE